MGRVLAELVVVGPAGGHGVRLHLRADLRIRHIPHRRLRRRPGAQFNSFVEISTDFSTDFTAEFLVLQGVPHYYKTSVEKSVEISTKLLN